MNEEQTKHDKITPVRGGRACALESPPSGKSEILLMRFRDDLEESSWSIGGNGHTDRGRVLWIDRHVVCVNSQPFVVGRINR